MKDLRSRLTDADPLRSEPGLSDGDAARMRSVILGSLREKPAAHVFWPRAVAVAAVVILMVVVGAIAGRRLPSRETGVPIETGSFPPAAGERRQVQFATPGGTRIIWTLDPEFQLKGVVP